MNTKHVFFLQSFKVPLENCLFQKVYYPIKEECSYFYPNVYQEWPLVSEDHMEWLIPQ